MPIGVALSRTERTLLINQYELLAKLDPDNADDYEEKIEILRWGFELLYEQALFGDYQETLTATECGYVMDVLTMYEVLQNSAGRVGLEDDRLTFPGFDGNSEGLHLIFAQHLRRANRWAHVKAGGKDLNSHSRTREIYNRMLAAFRPMYERILASAGTQFLTAAEVSEVLVAREYRM